jgi:hypothetical protein
MPKPNYRVLRVPLDDIVKDKELLPPGTSLPDISVLRIPAACVTGDTNHLNVSIGNSQGVVDQQIPLFTNAQPIHDSDGSDVGLYLTTDQAFVGAVLYLLLGFNRAPQPQP